MDEVALFPFSHYWWFYGAFTLFVLLLLALDLGVLHRDAHEVSIKEAAVWSIAWFPAQRLVTTTCNLGLSRALQPSA